MQQTSDTYKRILSGGSYWFENSVVVGDNGRLVDDDGGLILFGGDAILVDTGGPESGFREDKLYSVKTSQEFFKDGCPGVGSAVAGYVDVETVAPYNIPKKARTSIYVRASNGTETSEWIPQGVYFIDTREQTHTVNGYDVLKIKAYDAMLLAEITYPSDNQHDYPMLDKDMVQFIAKNMKIGPDDNGISVDPRTWDLLSAVVSTMDTISVTGIDNQDKFVGCANAVQNVIKQLREQAVSTDGKPKEDVANGR